MRFHSFAQLFAAALLFAVALAPAVAQPVGGDVTAPDTAIAAALFPGLDTPRIERQDGATPGWRVIERDGTLAGHVASTWEIARSVGYSGKPLEVLVAVNPDGVISGARLVRHSEPILTLGLSDADVARFVGGFAGVDLRDPLGASGGSPGAPDAIARATVSSAVIRDSILRTARTLALDRGLVPG